MIGPFLVLIAIGLFYVANKGKSYDFLQALNIFPGLSQEETTLGNNIGAWVKQNIWDNLATTIRGGLLGWLPFGLGQINSPGGSSSSGGGSGNNALVHGYNIPLQGGGSMTVNSTSQAGAIANVIAQGGTPAS